MALPINIETLINGKVIEWERLEFKAGWNPEDIVHTICAFANDINNWGGGYIIVGIDEDNGRPVLPPVGLNPNQIDNIQGEVLNLSHQIQPNYFPIIQPYVRQEKHILIIWCPAGDNRMYTAPSTQGKKAQRYPYIRFGSRSIIAKDDNLKRLQELTARIPFDDRIHQQAQVNDLDLGLIREFLQEVKSDLFEESQNLSFPDLCQNMNLVKGPDEFLRPINAAILFFTNNPEKYIDRGWIELVIHTDDSGRSFTEKYFKGALHKQLRAVLDYFKTNIIQEHVVKVSDKPEANRFYNYPFEALEEAIANAVYHKSYELGKPVEIQVWPDKIEILSFPGPAPPVTAKLLKEQRRIVSRDYRNRRIGDFLKELNLTEGRSTGFPLIYRQMEQNGSPLPVFETDEQAYYFLTILHQHPDCDNKLDDANQDSTLVSAPDNALKFNSIKEIIDFYNLQSALVSAPVKHQVSIDDKKKLNEIAKRELEDKAIEILTLLTDSEFSKKDIFEKVGLSNNTKHKQKYIDPLTGLGFIEFTIPDNPTDKNQKYRLTRLGENFINMLQ